MYTLGELIVLTHLTYTKGRTAIKDILSSSLMKDIIEGANILGMAMPAVQAEELPPDAGGMHPEETEPVQEKEETEASAVPAASAAEEIPAAANTIDLQETLVHAR